MVFRPAVQRGQIAKADLVTTILDSAKGKLIISGKVVKHTSNKYIAILVHF